MNWKAIAMVLMLLESIRFPFVVTPQKAKENLKAWARLFGLFK